MAELKNVAPLADFDWNAYESGDTQAVSYTHLTLPTNSLV